MNFQYYQGPIYISSENMKIHSFFQFLEKVHFLSNCKDNNCEIRTFIGCLKGVLLNPQKITMNRESFYFALNQFFKSIQIYVEFKKERDLHNNFIGRPEVFKEEKECLDKQLEEIKLEQKNDH